MDSRPSLPLLIYFVGLILTLMGLYLEHPGALPHVPEFPPEQISHLKGPQLLVLGLKIPVNQAGASDLEALPGVGPVLAQKIVRYREKRGSFQTIGALRQVTGIGELTLRKISPHLSLREDSSN